MKFFGYINGAGEQLVELNEVTIQAKAGVLREIAGFLLKCAKEMEDSNSWEHEHFSDCNFVDDASPDLVVFREV